MTRRTGDAYDLGQVVGKLDMVLLSVETLRTDVCSRLDKQDAKNETQDEIINDMKQWRARSTGYLAGGAAMLAIIFEAVRTIL